MVWPGLSNYAYYKVILLMTVSRQPKINTSKYKWFFRELSANTYDMEEASILSLMIIPASLLGRRSGRY